MWESAVELSNSVAGDVVVVSRDGAVGNIVLNRSAAMNAITVDLGMRLEQGLRELAESVAVIVLRGAGGNFSVGGDFDEVERLRRIGPAALYPLFENFGRACSAIAEIDVPVVAAVEGYALAGGFELMQASDIVLVSNDAKIADMHSNFGMVPGGGGSQRLARLVGRQRALAHILTGDRLSAAEAVSWGLAYRNYEPAEFNEAVREFGLRLASKSPRALRTVKRLVHDGLGKPLADGLAMEIDAVVAHLGDQDGGSAFEKFVTRKRS
ncbi:enoyl-CoA hydratase/isomerase family protein [Amycolatopsis sp.]|jgi:enoyl-CoA hydratase/carnithine racemase|uniref:enoyl-CoA hydratase/isomerase family protein n=1 Tax=Amycolatopsis sp. TaxID=37632 RepID=UPI002E06AC8B|nr:enoyl-CoA hydratase/isomerase family protein [Amycolatopsis sp.]